MTSPFDEAPFNLLTAPAGAEGEVATLPLPLLPFSVDGRLMGSSFGTGFLGCCCTWPLVEGEIFSALDRCWKINAFYNSFNREKVGNTEDETLDLFVEPCFAPETGCVGGGAFWASIIFIVLGILNFFAGGSGSSSKPQKKISVDFYIKCQHTVALGTRRFKLRRKRLCSRRLAFWKANVPDWWWFIGQIFDGFRVRPRFLLARYHFFKQIATRWVVGLVSVTVVIIIIGCRGWIWFVGGLGDHFWRVFRLGPWRIDL